MNNSSSTNSAAKNSRSLATARAVLGLAIVVALCYTAHGFGELWAEWRQVSQSKTAQQAASSDLDSLAAIVPLSGHWSFANLEWNIKSRVVSGTEVEPLLDTLATAPMTDVAAQSSAAGQELYDFVTGLGVRPIERSGNQVYRLDRGSLKAEMVVRNVSPGKQAIAMAAAYPQSGDQWQVFELTPRPATEDSDRAAANLLPLPAGARRSGGRFADDGRLLLELVALDSNADTLVSTWKDTGWEVRPTGIGGPDSFSYLCARGDEVIYAWSADSRGPLQNLMLVRTPGPADTNP